MIKIFTLAVFFHLLFLQTFTCFAQTALDLNFKPIIANDKADIAASALQPDGKIVIGGGFQFINNSAHSNVARLNPDGTIDPTFNIGTGSNHDIIQSIQIQGDGKILIAGWFTTFNNYAAPGLVRLNSNGSVDESFNVPTIVRLAISTIIMQPDGKILLGGNFYFPDTNKDTSVLRLNPDGSLDLTFASECSGRYQFSMALQTDGKIVLGGQGENPQSLIIRLNPDGTRDNTFIANTGIITHDIKSIALQDDKIIIAGKADGADTPYKIGIDKVIRLNTDGSLDNSFLIGSLSDETQRIATIKVLPNKKILLGGIIKAFNTYAINSLAQLNQDGSFDSNFKNDILPNSSIISLSIQNDNKILITGHRISLTGTSLTKCLFRLLSDGSSDSSFGPTLRISSTGEVTKIAIASDNKVLVAGQFFSFNDKNTKHLVRLLPDGRLDETFITEHLNFTKIHHLQIQPDEKILISGEWDHTSPEPKKYMIRLNRDGSLDPTFNLDVPSLTGVGGITLLPDGKILIIAATLSSKSYNTLFKLNLNGSMDAAFQSGLGAYITGERVNPPFISSIRLQTDGNIIIAGYFETYNGMAKNRIARLFPDGIVDESFTGPTIINNGFISTITIQSDNKIIIGGNFYIYDNPHNLSITRLQANGNVDEAFNGDTDGTPSIIQVEPSGKILVGGYFTKVNRLTRNSIARFNANGSIDNSFDVGSGANHFVNTIAYSLQDGTIYFGGSFSQLNNESQFSLARILPPPPAAPTTLAAILTPPNQVNLTWVDIADNELGYEIQRSRVAGSGFVGIDTTANNATTYIDKDLLGGTTYYYRIRAINSGGHSDFTTAISVTTDKLEQIITFNEIPAKEWGDAPFTLPATASSGLPVTFTLISGPATVTNNQISITGKGIVQIKASQPGNANFNPASEVSQSFTVHEAGPIVLTVSNITTTGLKLEWEGSSPEFKVLRKISASSTSPADGEIVYEGAGKSFAYSTELTPNTAYFFTVYGKVAGEKLYSLKNKKIATSTATPNEDKVSTIAFLAGETGIKALPNAAARVTITEASTTDGYIQVTAAANPTTTAALPAGVKGVIANKYWQIAGVGLDTETLKYTLTLDVSEISKENEFNNITVLQRANYTEVWTNLLTLNSNIQKTFQENKLTLTNLNIFPEIAFGVSSITGIEEVINSDFSLKQNYPNPFDNTSTIQYNLRKEAEVILEVIDAQGRIVRKLVQQTQKPGTYQVMLDGKSLKSRALYFIRLQANGYKSVISAIYR